MKLLKLLSEKPLENAASLLKNDTEEIILVGTKGRNETDGLKKILLSRGKDAVVNEKHICGEFFIEDGVNILENRVKDGTAVIDITGGEEMLVAAAGKISEKYPHVKLDFTNPHNTDIKLSICENALIHGGEASTLSELDYTDDFISDLEKLWKICFIGPVGYVHKRSAPATWNRFSVTVSGIERDTKKEQLEKLSKYKVKTYLAELKRNRLVSYKTENDGTLSDFSYKNEQVKAMITKAGNLLEQKVCLATKSLSYLGVNDTKCGVVLKWSSTDGSNTENEIDVFAMRGCIPVFISCKNGKFESEELYKLSAVADRFGSGYAKKILVASDLESTADLRTVRYLKERASEMNITIIDGAHRMSLQKLAKLLRKAIVS